MTVPDWRLIVGHVAAMSTAAIWAVALVMYRTLAGAAAPVEIAFSQLALAAPILLALAAPALWRMGRKWPLIPVMLLWGMIAPGFVLVLSATASVDLDGVVLNVFYGLLPLVVPIAAAVILKERVPMALPIGGVLALVGLVSVVLVRQASLAAPLIAYLAIIGAVLGASFSQIMGRFVLRDGPPPLVGAALQLTGALVTTSIILVIAGGRPFVPSGGQMPVFAYLVLGQGVANYLAFNLALRLLPAGWVSLYGGLTPAFGAIAAVLILGEHLPPGTAFMIVMVVIGVALPHVERILKHRRRGEL